MICRAINQFEPAAGKRNAGNERELVPAKRNYCYVELRPAGYGSQ
jgi:hypothetical protein